MKAHFRLTQIRQLRPFKLLSLILTGIVAMVGCKATLTHDGPRIFSIGRGATLSFEKGKDLEIPIEGMELANSLSHRIDVSLNATRPILPEDYTISSVKDNRDNIDLIKLTLKSSYLEKVATRDTLAVH